MKSETKTVIFIMIIFFIAFFSGWYKGIETFKEYRSLESKLCGSFIFSNYKNNTITCMHYTNYENYQFKIDIGEIEFVNKSMSEVGETITKDGKL